MSSYSESESSLSNQNDDYIKKHLNPVERGDSAIFGDPVSEQKNEILLPSPDVSYQQEEEAQERSKLDFDQNRSRSLMSRSRENGEKKHSNEDILEMMESMKPNGNPEIKKQQQIQQPKVEQKEEADRQQPHQQAQNGINEEINQNSQINEPIEQIQQQDAVNAVNPDHQIIQDQQLIERLQLKQQYYASLQVNQEQMNLMLQTFKRNSQNIDQALHHILHQNTILAQFKEDASRKLQENIKLTLKEKMNEINRQNSKQIKDIKNLTSTVQELLQTQQKRIQKMQKGIQQILSLVKGKR